MSRVESMTNPPTLGAGRRQSYRYPAITGAMSTGGLPTMTQAAGRPGETATGSQYSFTQTGVPPAGSVPSLYKGRISVDLTSSTGPVTGWQMIPNFGINTRPYVMPIQTAKGPVNFQGIDDMMNWSMSAILAYDAMPGTVTGDLGLVWAPGTATIIRGVSAFPGIEFGPTDVGTVGVLVRATNGGAITFNQNVTAPDMREWHRYEIRYIGPTATVDGFFRFLIDGSQVLTLSYGAGTVLMPNQNPFGTNLGSTPGLVNLGASASGTVKMHFAPDSLIVCCGPTEASLL